MAPSSADEQAVSLKTWIAVGGALIGAFMAVLNIQVTNSSLPDIEGGIGTGGVNGAWISTAYLIGEIIVIPMTDFLSRVFSLRRYLIANTVLFLLFSVACGQAHSLSEMIAAARLAGLFRRRADPARLHHHRVHAAAVEAAVGLRRLRHHRHVRAGDRPDDRRLADRQLRLADDLLHEPGAGRGDAVGADLRACRDRSRSPACCGKATGPALP